MSQIQKSLKEKSGTEPVYVFTNKTTMLLFTAFLLVCTYSDFNYTVTQWDDALLNTAYHSIRPECSFNLLVQKAYAVYF